MMLNLNLTSRKNEDEQVFVKKKQANNVFVKFDAFLIFCRFLAVHLIKKQKEKKVNFARFDPVYCAACV